MYICYFILQIGGIFIRTLKRIVVGLLLLVVTLQVAAFIAIQTPIIQTSIIKSVTNILEKKINGKIDIKKVYIIFFNKVILSDVSIINRESTPYLDSLKKEFNYTDTLLSCNKLSVKIAPSELIFNRIKIKDINIANGSFNLQNEGADGTNLSRIFNLDKKDKDTTKKSSLNLLANNLKIDNFRFTLKNCDRWYEKDSSTINFTDLDIDSIYIDIRDINLLNDTIRANVKSISGNDKSGVKLKEFNGKAVISSMEARVNNLYATDGYSYVNTDYFSLKYNTPKDFSDFIKKVRFDVEFEESYLDFKTIGDITPTLRNSSLAFYVTGKITGPIDHLKSESIKATSNSGLTFLDLDVDISGLPNVDETMAFAKVNNCHTTSNDISTIVSSINNTPRIKFFDNLPPLVRYSFDGSFTGLLTDFVTYGELKSSIGSMYVDALLNTNSGTDKGVLIKGKVNTTNLDLGEITSQNSLGKLSMRSSITTTVSKKNGVNISIDSVFVNKLGFNNYDYSNIFAIGSYNQESFDGRIICHDPNLDFLFQGLFSFGKKDDSKYKFYLDLPYANLANLNIDKRDSVSSVRFRTTADITKTLQGDIIGNLDIRNSIYSNSSGEFSLGNINLKSYETADSSYSSILDAPFIRAAYNGSAPFTSYIKKFLAVTLHHPYNKLFTSINDTQNVMDETDNYKLYIRTFNTIGVCEFLLPGLYISENTTIENTIDSTNNLKFNINSDRLAYNSNYLKDVDINLTSIFKEDATFNLNAKKSSIIGIGLDSLFINLKGKENRIESIIGFTNDSLDNNSANLYTVTNFKLDTLENNITKRVELNIYKSQLGVKGDRWEFAPSQIIYSDSTLNFNNLKIFNRDQNITVNGGVSAYRDVELEANLNNLNISMLNLFMNEDFNFNGYLSGTAKYSNFNLDRKVYLDITGDSITAAGHRLGEMRVLSKWSGEDKRFNLLLSTKESNKNNILATGYLEPKSKYLDVKANLDEFELGYFEPFLADIISKSSGNVSGSLNLFGPLDNLNLIGNNCMVNNYNFIVDFTGVPYSLNGPVNATKEGLFSSGLKISDNIKGSGDVTGGLRYNNFRDLFLDAEIEFKDMEGLKTTIKDNDLFYGNAFATGNLILKGPLNKILLDINVESNENTAIHIPLSDNYTATANNLLTFKNKDTIKVIDPYEILMEKKKSVIKQSEFEVNLNTNVNPLAEIIIEIDKSVGDVIKARGNGILNMDVNPSKEIFNVFGDYNITQGSYKFVFMGIAPKDFTIKPGGTINFNGDITNTTINLTATYSTKAAINTLIADTSSVSTRRTVNCGIIMSGSLMNPELAFSIDIPDLDPTTKVLVESALSSEGKIQKQFMALILSGSFIPDEQSGIANNTTLLYSNASEILSNQLNNIFQQLNIPIDLGLNYQPGTSGTDIFDVAVSTQLFNNRVSINGNIGNDPYSNRMSSWDVIGNIDVDIKIDKNGRLRLNIFSHAADQFSNYLDEKQRSGVGIGYQQEFNSFREIFKSKKRKKRESEQMQQKEENKTKQ